MGERPINLYPPSFRKLLQNSLRYWAVVWRICAEFTQPSIVMSKRVPDERETEGRWCLDRVDPEVEEGLNRDIATS